MTTYRLGSSPIAHMPGLIAWAINGAKFPADRAVMIDVISQTFPQVPVEAIGQLLTKAVPYTVEGDVVVFEVEG